MVRNTDHYRDHAQQRRDLEQAIAARIGEALGTALCARLRATSPRIYKDQLRAVRALLDTTPAPDPARLAELVARERLTATTLKAYLDAERSAAARGREAHTPPSGPPVDLSAYAGVLVLEREPSR